MNKPIAIVPAPLVSADNRKQKYGFNKLEKRIRRLAGEAIVDYGMIKEGSRVMVCLSGGADSYTMLDVLLYLQKVAPVNFSLIAVNLDPVSYTHLTLPTICSV